MVNDILNEQFASPTRGCMYNDERERECERERERESRDVCPIR